MRLRNLFFGTVLAGLAAAAVAQQYPGQTPFPQEDRAAVARQLAATRRIAGDDLAAEFNWRCLTSPLDRELVSGVQHNGLVPPTRIFDNLASIGQNAVSAHVIETSDGLIVIDALNSPAEARDILVPNLQALALDPARIRYVLITHGHGDHWGGAKYLQDTYGARVVSSDADWTAMESPGRGGGPVGDLVPPRRDITISDGQSITLGGITVRFYVTPGHTPGTLSMTFPVFERGRRHMAGLMGGTGGGQTEATVRQQISSLQRWQTLTRAAGVDVLVTNHPAHMQANEKQALIRYGATGGRNPYVYGVSRYQRFLQVMAGCSRVQLARMGRPSD